MAPSASVSTVATDSVVRPLPTQTGAVGTARFTRRTSSGSVASPVAAPDTMSPSASPRSQEFPRASLDRYLRWWRGVLYENVRRESRPARPAAARARRVSWAAPTTGPWSVNIMPVWTFTRMNRAPGCERDGHGAVRVVAQDVDPDGPIDGIDNGADHDSQRCDRLR